jgi:hypothetical protein
MSAVIIGSSKVSSSESELSSSLVSNGSSLVSSDGGSGLSSGVSGSGGGSGSDPSDLFADFTLTLIDWTDNGDVDTPSYFSFEISNIGEVSLDVTSITSDAGPIIIDLLLPVTLLPGQTASVFGETSPGTPISSTNFTVVTTIGTKFLFVD